MTDQEFEALKQRADEAYDSERWEEALDLYLEVGLNAVDQINHYPTNSGVRSVFSSDIDFDGSDELIVGTQNSYLNVMDVLPNNKWELKWKFKSSTRIRSIIVYDIDHDGEREVLASSANGYLYVLNSNGELKWEFYTNSRIWNINIADMNSDGELEVMLALEKNGFVILNVNGDILEKHNGIKSHLGAFNQVVNNNQRMVLGSIHDPQFIKVAPHFVYSSNSWLQAIYTKKDETIGIIVSSKNSRLHVYNAFLNKSWDYDLRDWARGVYIGDIDNDNRIEIIARLGDKLIVFSENGEVKWKFDISYSGFGVSTHWDSQVSKIRLLLGTNVGVHVYRIRDVGDCFRRICVVNEKTDNSPNKSLSIEQKHLLKKITSEIDIKNKYNENKYPHNLITQLKLRETPSKLKWEYKTGRRINRLHILKGSSTFGSKLLITFKDQSMALLSANGKTNAECEVGFNLKFVGQNLLAGCIICSSENTLYILDKNLKVSSEYKLNNMILSIYSGISEVNNHEKLIATTSDTRLWVFNSDLTLVSTYDLGYIATCHYLFDINGDGKSEFFLLSEKSELIVVDRMMKPLFHFQTAGRILRITASYLSGVGEIRIFIGSDDNHLYSLNKDGKLIWKFKAHDWISEIFVFDVYNTGDSNIVIYSSDKYLYVLTEHGKLLWKCYIDLWVYYTFIGSAVKQNKNSFPFEIIFRLQGKICAYEFIKQQYSDQIAHKCWHSDYIDSVKSSGDELTFIKQCLEDDEEYLRGFAIAKLAELQEISSDFFPILKERLKDPSQYVRKSFVTCLPYLYSKIPIEYFKLYLSRLSEDYEPEVRQNVVEILPHLLTTEKTLVFYYFDKFSQDEDDWVKQILIRYLSSFVCRYWEDAFSIGLRMIHDRENWIRHESARIIADLIDYHPDRLLPTLNALIEHNCPLEIYDYLSYLPKNEQAQKVFGVCFNLMSESSFADMAGYLEKAVEVFGGISTGEEFLQTFRYLKDFYDANSIEDLVKKH